MSAPVRQEPEGEAGYAPGGVAPKAPDVRALLRSPANFLALGAGSGLAPVAPGTFGTLAAIPVFLLMPASPVAYALILVAMFAFGVWCCDRCADDLGVHDHPAIVWDEVVGYLLTMFMVPKGLLPILLGFVLFRFFDILKPWPIGAVDRRVDGGFGIMADDVIAAVFAAVVLQVVLRLFG